MSIETEVGERPRRALQVVLEYENAVAPYEYQAWPLAASVGRCHCPDAVVFKLDENSSCLDDTRNTDQFHDSLVVAMVAMVAIVAIVTFHRTNFAWGKCGVTNRTPYPEARGAKEPIRRQTPPPYR